jgi:uncharacterized protein YehS (DUF1456 family)
LRRIRYSFDLSDSQMINLFELADLEVTREQVSNWLKKDEDESSQACNDTQLASFLNGLIIDRRGKRDGPKPVAEKTLTNNTVFRKLKIALDLKDDGVLEILQLTGTKISKHELSAFFRRLGHKHYRECKDQMLRNFLKGIQLKYRPRKQVD